MCQTYWVHVTMSLRVLGVMSHVIFFEIKKSAYFFLKSVQNNLWTNHNTHVTEGVWADGPPSTNGPALENGKKIIII